MPTADQSTSGFAGSKSAIALYVVMSTVLLVAMTVFFVVDLQERKALRQQLQQLEELQAENDRLMHEWIREMRNPTAGSTEEP